jgi:N utilization substance protein A
MAKTFDMQFIRYMNLFSKITRVDAKHCFNYNNMLVFAVDSRDVERALGRNNINLKKLSDVFGKRIRVVGEPLGEKDLKKFVAVIVHPVEFENAEILENEGKEREVLITTSGREPRAMLIGRNRAREQELKEILEQYFDVKVIKIN